MSKPRDLRRARGIPLIHVAVAARVSETTARVYEADPSAVSAEKRKALDRVYQALEHEHQLGAAAASPSSLPRRQS